MSDTVNKPPHYTHSAVEVIDAIEAWGLGYRLGNVVKYIARADHKGNRLEDLKKARWYLDREIAGSVGGSPGYRLKPLDRLARENTQLLPSSLQQVRNSLPPWVPTPAAVATALTPEGFERYYEAVE